MFIWYELLSKIVVTEIIWYSQVLWELLQTDSIIMFLKTIT